MSAQEIKTLLEVNKKKIMPMYPYEIINFYKNKEKNIPDKIIYKIVDCRKSQRLEFLKDSFKIKKKLIHELKVPINFFLILSLFFFAEDKKSR